MSLVNDMLNDLDDRRHQQAREEANLDWMTGQKQTSKNKWMMPSLALLMILVFVAVAFTAYRYQTTSNTVAVEKLEAIKPKVIAVEKKPVEPVVQVVKAAEPEAEIEQPVAAVVDTKPAPKQPAPVNVEPVKAAPVKPAKTVAAKKPKPLTVDQQDIKLSAQAKGLLRDGDYNQAEQLLSAFVNKNPLAVRSGGLLASLWVSQQNYQQAQTLLTVLRDVEPENIQLIMVQAQLYVATRQPDQAVSLLTSQSPVVSKHTDYYELLGYSARTTENYELSVQSYRRLLQFDPGQGNWWVGMAIALDMQNKDSLAKEAYRRGLESRNTSKALSDYAGKRIAKL